MAAKSPRSHAAANRLTLRWASGTCRPPATAPTANAPPAITTATASARRRWRSRAGDARCGPAPRTRCGWPPTCFRVACGAVVTSVDWIIVALTLVAAFAGYAQGFLVGAATLAGFAGGLFLGGRVGALVVDSGSQSPYAPLFGLVGALLGGLLLGSILERVGHGVRRR